MTLTISSIFCSLLILNTVVKIWLNYRNVKFIKKNYEDVPAAFAQKIDIASHQKAQSYSLDKIKYGQFFSSIDLCILIGWLFLGGLKWLDHVCSSIHPSPVMVGVAFFALFGFISSLLNLPESIYFTFVVEKKYGFNTTTVRTFIFDLVKSSILGAVIALPLIAFILWLMQTLGNWWWILAWVTLSLFQMLLIWVYPRIIAPLFNKFSPLDNLEIKDSLEELLQKIGFSNSGIFVMDASKRSKHGNAYFTGFKKNKRIVLFDTLLNSLSVSQIKAVLAHELGHFQKKHILKKIILSLIFSLIGFAILGAVYSIPEFYLAHAGAQPSAHMALLLFSLIAPIYTFLLTPIFSYFSRKDEFEADKFAAKHSNASDLIDALVKMHKDNASTLTPDPIYSAFYYSHPNAFDRISHLDRLNSECLT